MSSEKELVDSLLTLLVDAVCTASLSLVQRRVTQLL